MAVMLAALAWSTRAAAQDADAFAKPPEGTSAASRQARGQDAARSFMTGHYEEALQIYVDLYVESYGRVEYLRNIGRCQQRLGQHDLAIRSFKDYLLRGKMSATERAEVRGFIAESEKAKTEATVPVPAPTMSPGPAAPVPPSPAPVGPAVPVVGPPPATSPLPAPVASDSSATVSPPGPANVPAWSPPAPPPAQATAPLAPPAPAVRDETGGRGSGVKTAGRVLLIAAAVFAAAGTATLFVARSKFDSAKEHGCPNASDCGDLARSVSTTNRLSQAMYVGAVATGAAGGLMLLLAPTAESGAVHVAVGARFTFQ